MRGVFDSIGTYREHDVLEFFVFDARQRIAADARFHSHGPEAHEAVVAHLQRRDKRRIIQRELWRRLGEFGTLLWA